MPLPEHTLAKLRRGIDRLGRFVIGQIDQLNPGGQILLQQVPQHQGGLGLVHVLKAHVVDQVVVALALVSRHTSAIVRMRETDFSRAGFSDPA